MAAEKRVSALSAGSKRRADDEHALERNHLLRFIGISRNFAAAQRQQTNMLLLRFEEYERNKKEIERNKKENSERFARYRAKIKRKCEYLNGMEQQFEDFWREEVREGLVLRPEEANSVAGCSIGTVDSVVRPEEANTADCSSRTRGSAIASTVIFNFFFESVCCIGSY